MSTKIKELEAIRKTVTRYEDGITSGDVNLLRSAFHPQAMMYGCSGENVTIVGIDGLYDYVASQRPPVVTGESHRCFITKIDVADFAATAEVVQENCYGANYTNYFQLLKINGEWKIMSKAYNATVADQAVLQQSAVEKNMVA
jgi:hypothetical protein